MKKNEKDFVRIRHIEQAIQLIEEFVKGVPAGEFLKDLLRQSAVIRQLEIIGEAASNISEVIKKECPDIEWDKIKGFRNLVVHEYFRVDAGEVWTTVEYDLPRLKEQISMLLKSFE